MFSRAIISALSLFLTVNAQQQTPYQLDCDTTDLTSPPSTNLDDWVNSLLTVLHNNGKTAFEEVLVGFAATEDGYDVLEGMWESTANGGKGESWSLLIPSNEAFAASGLSSPYSQLDETTLYSLVTYHTLPVSLSASLPASGSANSSTSHLILETLFPLANGDGSVIVGDVSGDKVEVVSPIAGSIKLDDLDEGEQTGALTGLGLFEVDTILTPPPSLPTVLSTLTTSTSTLDKDSGLTLYIAALNRTNTLNTLTGFGSSGGSKGLTILAPIDAAFDGSMDSDSVTTWTKVLAGHFSSTQTLYSSDFNSTTKLYTSNGNALSFKTNSTGTYAVSSDGVSVTKILRSDILLENGGVMHVVDTLLASTTLQSTVATNGTTNGTSTSRTGGTLLGAASNVQVGVYGMTLAALVAVVGMF